MLFICILLHYINTEDTQIERKNCIILKSHNVNESERSFARIIIIRMSNLQNCIIVRIAIHIVRGLILKKMFTCNVHKLEFFELEFEFYNMRCT